MVLIIFCQVRGQGHKAKSAKTGSRGCGAVATDARVRARLSHHVRAGAAAAVLPDRQPAHRHAGRRATVGPFPSVTVVGGWP